MAQLDRDVVDKAVKRFRRRGILTLPEVAALLDSTVHTARRRLKEWKALTSYNRNGRYYALPDVPEFDANGLWSRQGVTFSRYGNLAETLVGLVGRSRAGLGAAQIRELTGLQPRSFLSAFAEHPRLKREKHQGRYVYFSSNPECGNSQRQQRRLIQKAIRLPTDFEAVAVLVEKIKHPALSNKALSRRLRKQKLSVDAEVIQNLFVHHGLAKKTLPSI